MVFGCDLFFCKQNTIHLYDLTKEKITVDAFQHAHLRNLKL